MTTDAQVEAAVAAAAEKANGGKFIDPLFYKPEHQKFWRDVVRTALEAAAKVPPPKPPKATKEEIATFSSHCVYIRSVYTLMLRIWRDSNDEERKLMEALSPSFFEDIGQVLGEFLVNAACRVSERAADAMGNENLTLELFLENFSPESETHKTLGEYLAIIKKHRRRVLPARNKLGAHADREVIRKGQPLGAAKWEEWEEFWSALESFVRLLNEKTTGQPFEINAGGVQGDAESLLKAIKQSRKFETLLESKDAAVQRACQELIATE